MGNRRDGGKGCVWRQTAKIVAKNDDGAPGDDPGPRFECGAVQFRAGSRRLREAPRR